MVFMGDYKNHPLDVKPRLHKPGVISSNISASQTPVPTTRGLSEEEQKDVSAALSQVQITGTDLACMGRCTICVCCNANQFCTERCGYGVLNNNLYVTHGNVSFKYKM